MLEALQKLCKSCLAPTVIIILNHPSPTPNPSHPFFVYVFFFYPVGHPLFLSTSVVGLILVQNGWVAPLEIGGASLHGGSTTPRPLRPYYTDEKGRKKTLAEPAHPASCIPRQHGRAGPRKKQKTDQTGRQTRVLRAQMPSMCRCSSKGSKDAGNAARCKPGRMLLDGVCWSALK